MPSISRRTFLKTAAAGAGAALAPAAAAAGPRGNRDDLHVAVIGVGRHGRTLMSECRKVPGVRFKAVCDIWPYYQQYAARRLKAYGQTVGAYADYREMLAAEKDLDAAIIASPDWCHAEQTVACLEAGLHVYCEKEMSNTLEGCRKIVQAARRTGKLVQVGRQHRSNPNYHVALEYIDGKKALGTITHVGGQWHGHKRLHIGWPENQAVAKADLEKYGYDTMERLRNWRWYEKFSGGPIANLGSHQIDVLNWFLDALPTSVYATGGLDYYRQYEWYDNVNCIYQWAPTKAGRLPVVRGAYEILNNVDHGGYYETFTGDEGTLVISEGPLEGPVFGGLWRENTAPVAEWEAPLLKTNQEARRLARIEHCVLTRYLGPIPPPGKHKPVYQCHLENFFDAIRGKATLTCPAEVGCQTAVSALRVNDAMKAGRRLEFKPEDFRA